MLSVPKELNIHGPKIQVKRIFLLHHFNYCRKYCQFTKHPAFPHFRVTSCVTLVSVIPRIRQCMTPMSGNSLSTVFIAISTPVASEAHSLQWAKIAQVFCNHYQILDICLWSSFEIWMKDSYKLIFLSRNKKFDASSIWHHAGQR